MTPEQKAREQIDAMLIASGWVVQDFKAVDFSAGRGIALREVPLTTGPCDYLLLVDRKAVGVVEAKKEGTTLSTVAEQSGRYASSLPDFLAAGLTGALPFLYESTGAETFFRDERDPAPRSRRLFSFHRPETLAEWSAESDTLRRRLAQMPFGSPLVTTGKRGDLDDFVACYFGEVGTPRRADRTPQRGVPTRHNRKESERFKSFTYDELTKRDKVNLDIFWLKDDALEESANLPAPEIIAADITADLEAALEQFATIAEDLKK